MPFPDASRVVYTHNPLVEVLCQFRFPPILTIETELPSEFQKSIREDYPLYSEKTELTFKVVEDPKSAPNINPPVTQRKNHEFLSADGQWKINLTRDFITFSTLSYTRWEDFKAHCIVPFEEFTKIYNPPFITRIGLRYKDVIVRSTLGLNEVSWTELLKPHVLGMMSSEVSNDISDTSHVTEIKLDDGVSAVRIANGIVTDIETKELCYSIDSDFFITQNTKIDDVTAKLDYFNKNSSRLIQWCITEKLHNAMEPTQI